MAGVNVAGIEPVPVSAALCSLLLASSLALRVPVIFPSAVGVNVTLTVQWLWAAKVVVHVVADTPKSPAVAIVMLFNGTPWLLVRVNNLGALVVPTAWALKTAVAGVSVAGPTPKPDNATVCGLLRALSVKVSVPRQHAQHFGREGDVHHAVRAYGQCGFARGRGNREIGAHGDPADGQQRIAAVGRLHRPGQAGGVDDLISKLQQGGRDHDDQRHIIDIHDVQSGVGTEIGMGVRKRVAVFSRQASVEG
jgi:hypothetical protein